jgi:hypothetical protein
MNNQDIFKEVSQSDREIYNNTIGKKLKNMAIFSGVVGAMASIVAGVTAIAFGATGGGGLMIALGFVGMILGSIFSFVFSFPLYGYGVLINNTFIIAENTQGLTKKEETKTDIKEEKSKRAPMTRKVEADEWRCPRCGVINKNCVGTCGCGQLKK